MSRIAIFSDVHGNLPALHTVLEDIKKRDVDQVFCLGDLVDFAPWANEVIELIRSQHIPCLMGNHDERIAFDQIIVPLQKHNEQETAARIQAINYTKRTITTDNKKYLAGLPMQLRLTFNLKGIQVQVLMVHASVNNNDEYIYENHQENELNKMMEQAGADILIMGHTHLSYIRQLPASVNGFNKLAINCGSVGRSKEGSARATYLLLDSNDYEVKANLVKLEYPVEDTFNAILHSEIPDFYGNFLLNREM